MLYATATMDIIGIMGTAVVETGGEEYNKKDEDNSLTVNELDLKKEFQKHVAQFQVKDTATTNKPLSKTARDILSEGR